MPLSLMSSRFDGLRTPAWRTLGSPVEPAVVHDVYEAFARAGILHQYEKMQHAAFASDGTRIDLPDVALMRAPTASDASYRRVAYVDPHHGVIQQEDLARWIQPLADEWPLDAVGYIDADETTFATFKAGMYDVFGDPIERYLFVADSKGGARALLISLIDIRLGCTNQIHAALHRARDLFRIALVHRRTVEKDLQTYVTLFAHISRAQEQQRAAFERLAQTKVTESDVRMIMERTFRLPPRPAKLKTYKALTQQTDAGLATQRDFLRAAEQQAVDILDPTLRTYERRVAHTRELRAMGMELYNKFNDEHPSLSRTAWAGLNGAGELSDNRAGKNEKSIATASLFGDRLRERSRAFRAAWRLTKSRDV